MISKDTVRQIVAELIEWEMTESIEAPTTLDLLTRLATISGTLSFCQSIAAVREEYQRQFGETDAEEILVRSQRRTRTRGNAQNRNTKTSKNPRSKRSR